MVDDDPIVRNVVREHLRRNGYTVIETASGEEALEVVGKQHVDAVLLDLCMPGMSGWETLERLKKNGADGGYPSGGAECAFTCDANAGCADDPGMGSEAFP